MIVAEVSVISYSMPLLKASRLMWTRSVGLPHSCRFYWEQYLPQQRVPVSSRSQPAKPSSPHLSVTPRSEEGEIMALAHRHHPTFGVQFHPESILTQEGHVVLMNFLQLAETGYALQDFIVPVPAQRENE